MKGAREFRGLFKGREQVGRLFISSGCHARGETLHVWVLPPGETVPSDGWPSSNAVEVYGVTGGQPGWTESYGWLHTGKWQEDFEKLVAERRAAIAAEAKRRDEQRAEALALEKERAAKLLGDY